MGTSPWLSASVTPSVLPSYGLAVPGSGNKRHMVVRLWQISDKPGRSSARPQRNKKRGTNFPANGEVGNIKSMMVAVRGHVDFAFSRHHRVESGFNHVSLAAVDFLQDLRERRLQFLGRKLMPCFFRYRPWPSGEAGEEQLIDPFQIGH